VRNEDEEKKHNCFLSQEMMKEGRKTIDIHKYPMKDFDYVFIKTLQNCHFNYKYQILEEKIF